MVKAVESYVCVDSISVTIEPIKTREGKEITHLALSDGRVISVAGPMYPHMGSGFFKENFSRETIRGIERVGKSEWKRVMAIMESINFKVVPKED